MVKIITREIFPGSFFCLVKNFSSMCEGSYIEQTVEVCVMVLLHFFQVTPPRGPSGDLPDPAGPLSLLLCTFVSDRRSKCSCCQHLATRGREFKVENRAPFQAYK